MPRLESDPMPVHPNNVAQVPKVHPYNVVQMPTNKIDIGTTVFKTKRQIMTCRGISRSQIDMDTEKKLKTKMR